MGKYDQLGHYLLTTRQAKVDLTFSQIESILGFALPKSAYTYSEWWSNTGHSHADSWVKAGYLTKDIRVHSHIMHFVKASEQKSIIAENRQASMQKGASVKSTVRTEHVAVPQQSQLHLCGYDFLFVQYLIPESENGHVKEFHPENAYGKKNNLPLLANGSGPFCRFSIQAPPSPGVYLWIVDSEIIYIGETVNLLQRFNTGYGNISPRNCYIGGQSTNCKMNKVVLQSCKQGKKIALYFHETENYKQVELNLLTQINTKYNVKDNH